MIETYVLFHKKESALSSKDGNQMKLLFKFLLFAKSHKDRFELTYLRININLVNRMEKLIKKIMTLFKSCLCSQVLQDNL